MRVWLYLVLPLAFLLALPIGVTDSCADQGCSSRATTLIGLEMPVEVNGLLMLGLLLVAGHLFARSRRN